MADSDTVPQSGSGHRGRTRDPAVDVAIAEAARALLEEGGLAELTMEAVARRAGVARATVYRRWQNREQLLAQLLRDLISDVPLPNTGGLRGDLIGFLDAQLAFLVTDGGRGYPSLSVQATSEPSVAQALNELVQRRKTSLALLLARGVERGELAGDIDPHLAYLLLWGPIYYRYLEMLGDQQPIEPDFVPRIVDAILRSLAASGAR